MVDWHLQREDCVNQQMFLSFIRDFLSSKGPNSEKNNGYMHIMSSMHYRLFNYYYFQDMAKI